MLLQNQTLFAAQPYRRLGGAVAVDRMLFGRSSMRNMFAGEGLTDKTASIPRGYRAPVAWLPAMKAGGLASYNEANGAATVTGTGAMGINITATSDGIATLEAVGQLVVSAVATISGQATVSATILAALAASATLAGAGSVTASATALGWAIAAIEGTASTSITPYATGAMTASIDVAATADLTAAAIADEILDSQMVETGLTVRETLRLCAAALAGKVSISGNTVTIRNAVADDTDRITATTTTEGERTAITYDLG